ncbi:MAG TPA: ATP-binding cassette domain-containing protein [Phycisphaerae bacterium]|nr:ATP-binding cassette domain-containing protein [Phycisphaerae bacterium]HNU46295.1 ATP-binding cassette domain-containing protein [Phycisphaerae bacterium]
MDRSAPATNVHPNGEPVVRLEGVRKQFGKLVVLNGVDLTLPRGLTTVIIGESGAGKSVILKHIVRLLQPDGGAVYYEGERIDNLPERRLAKIRPDFGFLFQLSALFDSMTVGENVAFPILEHRQVTRREAVRRAREKLALVGLEGIEKQMPAELSGGQRKRVALARAIAQDPKLILYDEPTTGLDPPRADVINELILKLQHELHVTSVVVTHDMASATKVADRILMLYQGKIIYEGTSRSILEADDARVRCFVHGRAFEEDLQSLQGAR